MNRLLKTVILLAGVMFIGSALLFAESKGNPFSNIDNTEAVGLEITQDPIARIDGTNNALYPVQETEGIYDGMILEWEGSRVNLPWKCISSEAESVQLWSSDITGDGIADAVVALPAADGTGIYVEQLHIVDGAGKFEIPVEDAVAAAEQYIQKSSDFETDRDSVSVGNVVDYEISGNKLTATLGIAVSFTQYIGDIIVNYTYNAERQELELESMLYQAF